jgi:hypothetical protein
MKDEIDFSNAKRGALIKESCPACDVGKLQPKECDESIDYKGVTLPVTGYIYSLCDTCGIEILNSKQMDFNDRLFQNAIKAYKTLDAES